MAGMQLSSVGLQDSIAHVFRARNILTAKDALFKTELELVELLDVPFEEVQSALAIISARVCPPCHSVFDILSERAKNEVAFGHLPTGLPALDASLWGGIPFGVMTEVVGPAGIGKTQFCLLLSVLAAMPEELGGLGGSVIYIDTEKKFRSGRLLQIAKSRFAEHFKSHQVLEKLASRVLTVQPDTVAELMLRLQGLEEAILQHSVRLLVIDSVAALMQSEYGRDSIAQRQEILGRQASILKHLAEAHRMPVIVTNQVRFQGGPGEQVTAFTTSGKKEIVLTAEAASREGLDLQLTAALGTKWAHAVNIRLVLESISGYRYIKIAKSPMSATIAFNYEVTAAGIEQIGDETFDASDGGRNMIQWLVPSPLCFSVPQILHPYEEPYDKFVLQNMYFPIIGRQSRQRQLTHLKDAVIKAWNLRHFFFPALTLLHAVPALQIPDQHFALNHYSVTRLLNSIENG